MKQKTDHKQKARRLSPEPLGSGPVILDDGTEVLYDIRTPTTRWTLWRHAETKHLCLALTQHNKSVTVDIRNVRELLTNVVPRYEATNIKADA